MAHESARLAAGAQRRALGGQSPLSLLNTEESSRLVEAVLGRIAHGIVE
jgi:uncharacterized protein (DUF2384 family)